MNAEHITLAPVFPLWLLLLFLLLGAAAGVWQFGLLRPKLGVERALKISLLRLAGVLLLIGFALNPSGVSRQEHRIPTPLALLVDVSQSMDLSSGREKGTRLDEVKEILFGGPRPLLQALSEQYDVRLYALGDSLRSLTPEELKRWKAGGKKGDLPEALDKLAGKASGAVLFSDGRLREEGKFRPSFPLFSIPAGDPGNYKDILIQGVKAPAIAFRGRELTIEATVKSYGFRNLSVPVLLKNGPKLLAARTLRLKDDPAEVGVALSFTPEEAGPYNLSLAIPPQFGEALSSNNAISLSLKVVRDKMRIFMVSGSPSLNYRYMRSAFKNDPSLDLLSFVILRTPSDIVNVPPQELSLIPFPVETLFSKELENFDLLVFDNFPYNLYLKPKDLEKIRDYVRAGGAFAVIGGSNLSEGARSAEGPIEEILPVRGKGKEVYRRSASGVQLTRAGKTHPITRLSPMEADNAGLWREMPPLEGLNLLEAKSSAKTLLESAEGSSRPVLTVGNYGKGRVLALATDSSWRWYMGMVARGKGNWAYLRLMERMVRWLTRDPSLEPVQITLAEAGGKVGQEKEIRIQVREEDLPAKSLGGVGLSVLTPEGAKMEAQLKAAGPGEYLGSFLPARGGLFKVKVETSAGKVEESVAISDPLEDLDGAPQHEQLKRISASTGGKIFSPGDDLLKELKAIPGKAPDRFLEEKSAPLWGSVYVFACVMALLGTEWYLRRKWGLV